MDLSASHVVKPFEAQSVFVVLLEDAMRQPDMAKSVQRLQLDVEEAKVRLDLAATQGAWLMTSRMAINTGRTVAYNNKLRQATPKMKLELNNEKNTETKNLGCASRTGVLQN